MVRRLLVLLACAVALAFAQAPAPTPVPVQFGGLYCAAIRRPSAQVQTYCYAYPPNPDWKLVENQISDVALGGSVVQTDTGTTVSAGTVVAWSRCSKWAVDTKMCLTVEGCIWEFAVLEDGTVAYNATGVVNNALTLLKSGVLP